MKVLLVEPGKNPRTVEIEHTLEAMYQVLDCDTITATYPWEDPVGLVTDDEGLFKDKPWNRVIDRYTAIKGNFFLCGLGPEDFTDLPEELMEKYKRLFWCPQLFIPTSEGMLVLHLDDDGECR